MADLTVSQLEDLARFAYEQGNIEKARERLAQADALKMEQAQARGDVKEFGYAGGAGVLRGASGVVDLLGQAPELLTQLVSGGGEKMMDILGLSSGRAPSETQKRVLGAAFGDAGEQPTPSTLQQEVAKMTGGYSEYRSPLVSGQYGGTLGEFTGGAAAMPIGGPLRAVGSTVLPAIASETAGQITKGTEYENMARIAAALGIPVAQALATPALRRMAIGDPSEVQAYVKGSTRPQSVGILERAGVEDISAGQELGSEALMRLEGRVGPSLTSMGQLTRAVAKEAGIDTDAGVLSANVVNTNRQRLGSVFDQADDLAGGVPTQAEGMAAVNLVGTAEEFMTEGVKIPKALNDTANTIGNAFIDGVELDAKTIKQMRAKLNEAIKRYSRAADKQIEYGLAEDLLETLDDMVTRQISATSPEFVDTLNTARQQYRAHLTMERALTGGGQGKAAGRISPESLASATQRREGVSYVRGTGSDLGELARASQEVLTPLPRVAEGGVRFPDPRVGQLRDVIPSMAASRMQETLPMPARQAITQRLLERLARQTGGLLSID